MSSDWDDSKSKVVVDSIIYNFVVQGKNQFGHLGGQNHGTSHEILLGQHCRSILIIMISAIIEWA